MAFGTLFNITTFGESHGKLIGVTIEGCPPNIQLNLNAIQHELDRRKPGQSAIVTQRKEDNEFEIVTGFFDGKTTGTPLTILIYNQNQQSHDYEHIKNTYRPSHADYTYQAKYGIRDYKGGGRSSARETACRVLAGAIAKQILAQRGITIQGYVSQVGHLKLPKQHHLLNLKQTEQTIVRCPDIELANQMIELIKKTRKNGDTIGGQVSCVIKGVPVGIGEPVFDKLHARLGLAMLSINAVKGFEYGSGFKACSMLGSEHNDQFTIEQEKVTTTTNYSGGIQGGISNGMPIYFNVAFKPVATLMQPQTTINTNKETVQMQGKGRHDPCVVPRAVPIVEAMAAITILDLYLQQQAYNEFQPK